MAAKHIERYIRAEDADRMCVDLVMSGRKNCTEIACEDKENALRLVRAVPKGGAFVATKPVRKNWYNSWTGKNESKWEFFVGWKCSVSDVVSLDELIGVGVPEDAAVQAYNQWKDTNIVQFLTAVFGHKRRGWFASPSHVAASAIAGFVYSFRPCCVRWHGWRLKRARMFFERPLPTLFTIWEGLKVPYSILTGAIHLNKRGVDWCARLIKKGSWRKALSFLDLAGDTYMENQSLLVKCFGCKLKREGLLGYFNKPCKASQVVQAKKGG